MQTFLPYPDFAMSAAVLDRQRLGKQRLENLQIMKALLLSQGWVSHPATLMWRRYEWALLKYHQAIVHEWSDIRGYSDTTLDKLDTMYHKYRYWTEEMIWPRWLGDDAFHLSHRSNLMRKDRTYYSQYFPGTPDYMPYIWPKPEREYLKPHPFWSPPE